MTYTDLPTWTIPLWFFFWAPILVMLVFVLMGRMARRCGIARALEGDWNGYSTADVHKLLTLYGDKGRATYRQTLLPADAAFAVFYATVALILGAGLIARGLPLWLAVLCAGPWVVAAIADLMEGASLSRLLARFPTLADAEVARASLFTRIKLVLFALGIPAVIGAFVLAVRPGVFLG